MGAVVHLAICNFLGNLLDVHILLICCIFKIVPFIERAREGKLSDRALTKILWEISSSN